MVRFVPDRSGCGPIDLAVLQAADTRGANRPGPYVPCAQVLPRIEERTGLGPRYAYDVLLDLARPWVIAVPTITAHGNIGDRDSPASAPRHVECRASRAGQAILDAEAGRIAPVPAGLINGTAYRGGIQPPLEPSRVIAALRHLLDHPRASDSDILDIAGATFSVTSATVTGDLDALAAGHEIMLRQTGRITLTGHPIPEPRPATRPGPGEPKPTARAWFSSEPDPGGRYYARAQILIESLPADIRPGQVIRDLASLADSRALTARKGYSSHGALPIAGVADLGTSECPVRIAITLMPRTDPETFRDQLAALDGVTTQALAAYPAPLAALLRTWTSQHGSEDIAVSLARFEDAIAAIKAAAE
jgi:hypothetical protein